MTLDLNKIDAAYEKFQQGAQPRDWIPDPEIDYRDAVKCSVCGACDIARSDDDDPYSYCTSCAVNSEDALRALLVNSYPDLREEVKRLREIERGVQQMTLLDATSEGEHVVFRFHMAGEQLFNPPAFYRTALAQKQGEETSD